MQNKANVNVSYERVHSDDVTGLAWNVQQQEPIVNRCHLRRSSTVSASILNEFRFGYRKPEPTS
jgi:hypothetical protein